MTTTISFNPSELDGEDAIRRVDHDEPPLDGPPIFDEEASLFVRDAMTPRAMPMPVRAIDVADTDVVAFSVAEMITAGDFGMFAGEDGSMKTTVALHIAGAMSGGYRAFGRFQTQQATVLFVSEEDSAAVLKNRLEAMCRGHGWNGGVVLSNVHILARAEVRLSSPAWRLHLLALIEQLNIGFVVIDPLIEVTTGEENSPSEGRDNLQVLRALARPTGANVAVVHHFGKPGEGAKRMKDRIRGNTSISSGSRFTYVIEHDEEAHELKVTCVKLSRGEKLKPFVVRYIIDAQEENRTVWTKARFEYVSVQEATLDHAEAFVIEQLSLGERMTTTELKAAATGTGVSGQDIARALKLLNMRQKIDFEPGLKNSKRWGLVCLPEESRQPRQSEFLIAGQAE